MRAKPNKYVVIVLTGAGAVGLFLSCTDTTSTPTPSTFAIKGACCAGLEGECVGATREECLEGQGEYLGDRIPCTDTICGTIEGACCIKGQDCQLTNQAACDAESFRLSGGSFFGIDTSCEGRDCTIGACCTSDQCEETVPEECEGEDSTYRGIGTSCDTEECRPTGACCTDGDCISGVRDSLCAVFGGNWLGLDTTCDGVNCDTGACCMRELCEITDETDCTFMDGTYQAGVSACQNDTCDEDGEPRGACCLASSSDSCGELTEAFCNADLGAYQGNNTTCDPNPCGEPTLEITDLSYNATVTVNQGGTGDMTITWSGSPTFPMTVTFRLKEGASCPFESGGCTTASRTIDSSQNPLLVPSLPACFNPDDPEDLPATLEYEVLISDASGLESAPVDATWTCAPVTN